jgi:acyl carrier protein
MGVQHVMDSRSLAFTDQILEATNGEGVHVVLNSLAGDFIPASIRTLAVGGRFLELGKRDIWSPEAVANVRPDVDYYVYDLGAEAQADHGLLRPILDEILTALAEGSLHPLPVTVFPLDDVSGAMRFMAQARHVGKIVVRVAADKGSGTSAQLRPSEMATYWITGGLGPLGLETARWLVQRGARYLVLCGRRPPSTSAEACIREFEHLGVTVRVFQADAADRDRMQFVVDEIGRSLPPLRGVVHAAGAVHDAVLMNQYWAEGRETFRGKVDGAWVLHEITRDIPLEFFVLYSAAGVLLGAAGQGMYPAANAELDALAYVRRRLGLPALSVAWGPWAGAGMAADFAARGRDVWQDRGLGKIEPVGGFSQLERLLADGATYGAVIPIRWTRFLAQLPAGADRNFFSAVGPAPSLMARGAPPAQCAVILERLRELPLGQRRQGLIACLAERALHVLGVDATTSVELRVPLKEIGLDSLMAVELSNSLVRLGGQILPATLLFDYPTLEALATYLARAWRLEVDAADAIGDSTSVKSINAVANLSDREAEALLLEELELSTVGRRA